MLTVRLTGSLNWHIKVGKFLRTAFSWEEAEDLTAPLHTPHRTRRTSCGPWRIGKPRSAALQPLPRAGAVCGRCLSSVCTAGPGLFPEGAGGCPHWIRPSLLARSQQNAAARGSPEETLSPSADGKVRHQAGGHLPPCFCMEGGALRSPFMGALVSFLRPLCPDAVASRCSYSGGLRLYSLVLKEDGHFRPAAPLF